LESREIWVRGDAHDLLLRVLRGPVAEMYSGQLVFGQIMEWVPHWEFQRLVRRYGTSIGSGLSNYHIRLCAALSKIGEDRNLSET